MPQSTKRLSELRALGTQGEWLLSSTADKDGWATCSAIASTGGKGNTIYCAPKTGVFPYADKTLIVETINALPKLIKIIEIQREALEEFASTFSKKECIEMQKDDHVCCLDHKDEMYLGDCGEVIHKALKEIKRIEDE